MPKINKIGKSNNAKEQTKTIDAPDKRHISISLLK